MIPDAPLRIATGTKIGHYEIVGWLGAGGMSACGYAEPRTCKSETEVSASVRGGRGGTL